MNMVQVVVEIWRGLFNDQSITETDNFFLSGGHSLAAARMLYQVADRTGVVVPLIDFLDDPTPQGLARAICPAN